MSSKPPKSIVCSVTWGQAWKCLLMTAALAVLTACGGGGGSSADPIVTATGPGGTASMTGAISSVVLDTNQAGLMSITNTANSDGSTQSTVTLPAELAKSMAVQTGKTIVIPPGQDDRFPLGFAAVVGATSADPTTGAVTAAVVPATLRDAYSQVSVSADNIALSADNFIGAIAPLAISGGNATPTATQAGLLKSTGVVKVFNGALTLTSSASKGAQAGLNISQPDLALGEIKLVAEVKLADLLTESELSLAKPYGNSGEAKVVINLQLKDLMLTQKAEFEDVLNVPYALKSMNYKVKGSMVGEVKLTGGLTGDLGYYSRAWHETEVEGTKLFGVSGKLLGLDAKDKVGKIPLAGLVFSVPCAATCPVTFGQNQTPIRLASAGGVIVWLYLDAKGNITFEGGVGTRTNAGFELGAAQPEGGALDAVFKFAKLGNEKNLLEAPFIAGELNAQANLGIAMDVDAFMGGVRFLNLSMAAGAQANLNLNAQMANTLPDVGQPWQWQGSACLTTSVGAGVVTHARLGIGGQVKTTWKDVSVSLTYEDQWPKAEELSQPGPHDVLGIPVWYTFAAKAVCYPTPVVDTIVATQNGTVYGWAVAGQNLPDDLDLVVATTGMCLTKPQRTWNAADAGTKASFSCEGGASVLTASGAVSSAKATNMTGNMQWTFAGNALSVPTITSISPAQASSGFPFTVTVAGQNLPLTAVLTMAEAICQTPTVRTSTGFAVVCTPGATVGAKVLTVTTNTLANGGTVIDATRSVTVVAEVPVCTSPQVLTNGVCASPPPGLIAPTSLAPSGTITSLTPVFSWSGGSGAANYEVNVRDQTTGMIVLRQQGISTGNTSFTMPAGILVNARQYRWDITACPDFACNSGYVTSGDLVFDTQVEPVQAPGQVLVRAGDILTVNFAFQQSFSATPSVIRFGFRPDPVTDLSSFYTVTTDLFNGATQLGRQEITWGPGNGFGWFFVASDCPGGTVDFTSIRNRTIAGRFEAVAPKDYAFQRNGLLMDSTNCGGTAIVGTGSITSVLVNGAPVPD